MSETCTLRTTLRLPWAGTRTTGADLLERAVGWAESWATNDSAENPEAIEADAALAREALAQPGVANGWVYLSQEQLNASVRILDDAQEYARANDYAETGSDPVEIALGQDTGVVLFHWPEEKTAAK